MTPTELAIKEAKQSERLKLLLMAKNSKSLEDLIKQLENQIAKE